MTPHREATLRETLPHLHVGRWQRSRWHILSADRQKPLCMPFYPGLIDEEDALDQTPVGTLCQHCARTQGDDYGEW